MTTSAGEVRHFYDPHPGDETGPGVPLPHLVKLYLDSINGRTLSLATVMVSLGAISTGRPDWQSSVKDCGDCLQYSVVYSDRDYPRHHWLAIRCREPATPAPSDRQTNAGEVTDSNVESVIQKHRQRAEAGLRKYGITTERGDLSTAEWLQHLQEELMDATVYIEAMKSATHAPSEPVREPLTFQWSKRSYEIRQLAKAYLESAKPSEPPTEPGEDVLEKIRDYERHMVKFEPHKAHPTPSEAVTREEVDAIKSAVDGHAPLYHSLVAGQEPRRLTLLEQIRWMAFCADDLPLVKDRLTQANATIATLTAENADLRAALKQAESDRDETT